MPVNPLPCRAAPVPGKPRLAMNAMNAMNAMSRSDTEDEKLSTNSGAEEDRTPNLGIANAALSQLSYRPVVWGNTRGFPAGNMIVWHAGGAVQRVCGGAFPVLPRFLPRGPCGDEIPSCRSSAR